MEPLPESEIAADLRPFLVVYKDGRVQRFMGTDTVAPSSDAAVQSKDVPISSSAPGVSARLYLPAAAKEGAKLPLIIYFHGGGFVIESAQSPTYHHYLNRVAVEASAVVVSVDYRRAPEHPLPAAYDDSWEAVLWAASLSDPWLAESADLSRVFFAGDSAGGNIAHHMAVRFGRAGPGGVKMNLAGLALVHPFFLSKDRVGAEDAVGFWKFLCPEESGVDHPWINPTADGSLAAVGARRAVVFVAGDDPLRVRGAWYADQLRISGWPGQVRLLESMGEGHVFHLFNHTSPNSQEMMTNLVQFINT